MQPPSTILMSPARDSSDWMREVAAGAVLETAFDWLCNRRVDYADSADVWNVRFRWAEIKVQLHRDLLGGQYRFSPLRRIQTDDGECIELWNALDALVLKALSIVLNRRLDLPRSCYHLPGKEGEAKRGAKAAVRHICSRLVAGKPVRFPQRREELLCQHRSWRAAGSGSESLPEALLRALRADVLRFRAVSGAKQLADKMSATGAPLEN